MLRQDKGPGVAGGHLHPDTRPCSIWPTRRGAELRATVGTSPSPFPSLTPRVPTKHNTSALTSVPRRCRTRGAQIPHPGPHIATRKGEHNSDTQRAPRPSRGRPPAALTRPPALPCPAGSHRAVSSGLPHRGRPKAKAAGKRLFQESTWGCRCGSPPRAGPGDAQLSVQPSRPARSRAPLSPRRAGPPFCGGAGGEEPQPSLATTLWWERGLGASGSFPQRCSACSLLRLPVWAQPSHPMFPAGTPQQGEAHPKKVYFQPFIFH